MEHNLAKISKTLLDLSRFADVALFTTAKGRAALKTKDLDVAQRCLLDRIDGFRSLEQVLAISGDLIAVHSALGKLMALGFVTTDSAVGLGSAPEPAPAPPPRPAASPTPVAVAKPAPRPEAKAETKGAARPAASPAATPAPAPKPAAAAVVPLAAKAKPPAAPAVARTAAAPLAGGSSELDRAKHLLLNESKLALGDAAAARMQPRIEACRSIEEIYDLIVKVQQHLAKGGKVDPDVFLDRLSQGLAAAREKNAAAARSVG
jgi:hypothetical protein